MNIRVPSEEIKRLCTKWNIKDLSVFGSVLREDFSDQSDIDILLTFDDDASYGFFELSEIQEEFVLLFKRKVDVVTRNGVESSRNNLRKKAILNSARTLYAS